MSSFLKEVAKALVLTFNDLKDVVLILPSKRSGVVLKNELIQCNTVTTYAPQIYSIEDFVEELSGLQLAENIQLLFELYEIYKKETPEEEPDSFQQFSRWAQIVLQDFNEIDRHLVDHNQILTYLSSIKEINHWYLQEEKTNLQKNYIAFWNNLKVYYVKLRDQLLKKRMAYQGLLYREAFNNTESYLEEHPEKHHVFIGFNALNRAEEKMIRSFLLSPDNMIFWDIDETFLADSEHDAGLFMRTYKKEWPYFKDHEFKFISHHFKEEKDIRIIGIPKTVGQAKYTGKLIDDIHTEKGNTNNTVVILGNEHLLTPVLNAIPPAISSVNVTYGIPLYQAPVSSFFSALFRLLETGKKKVWYYKNVLHILSHSLTKKLLTYEEKDHTKRLIEGIQRDNIVFVSSGYLQSNLPGALSRVVDHIFMKAEGLTVNKVIKNCISLIHLFREHYQAHPVYLEYLYKFHELFNRILHLNRVYHSISDIASLKRIYHELLRGETVNFRGASLQGLQIMGMLESRNLDFEHVIITGVNEGILPSGKKHPSFLPFQVKSMFNLPTYKEKDAIYTYHFYRLLQRARHIYLLYNTEPDVLEGGEKSRFLLQLITQKQPRHHIKEIIARPEIAHTPQKKLEIKKNARVIAALMESAEKGFSPTLLSKYIRNPIEFYHHAVLRVPPEDEMEETVTAKTLGTIIHGVLEALYRPLEGKMLEKAHLTKMKSSMDTVISRNFAKVYEEEQWSTGKNHISFAIVKRYMQHLLQLEQDRLDSGAQIRILYIEKSLETRLPVPELGFSVTLKGTLDRVEAVDGVIHITDYKTGKVIPSDIEIAEESAITEDKYHKAFQLLSYIYLYAKNYGMDNPVEASVLSFKNLKSGYLKFGKKGGKGTHQTTRIGEEMLTAYENRCKALLLEIFDPEMPFREKETDGQITAPAEKRALP